MPSFPYTFNPFTGNFDSTPEPIAENVIARVYNAESSATLTRGQVVYSFGAQGDTMSVKLASNTTDDTSARTLGFVNETIAPGNYGYVTIAGSLNKLHLGSPFLNGDVLWLDSTPGAYTRVKPTAPNHSVYLGVVERANNGNGIAYVKIQNGQELDELHDVSITSLSAGQVLRRNNSNTFWENTSDLTISSTGNVGIGTINPSHKLTVSENLSVGGDIFNDGAEFINKLPNTSNLTTSGTLFIHNGGSRATSMTCNSQQLFLMPIWVPTDCFVDQAGIFAGPNASSVDVKICIYDGRVDGRPGARIGPVATVASGTAGAVYIASSFSSSISLKRGNYYAGVMGFGANVVLNQSVAGGSTMPNGLAILSGIYRMLPGYFDMQGGHLITAVSAGQEPPADLSSRTLDTVTSSGTGILAACRYRVTAPFAFFRLVI